MRLRGRRPPLLARAALNSGKKVLKAPESRERKRGGVSRNTIHWECPKKLKQEMMLRRSPKMNKDFRYIQFNISYRILAGKKKSAGVGGGR